MLFTLSLRLFALQKSTSLVRGRQGLRIPKKLDKSFIYISDQITKTKNAEEV